jgi:hypothetical protein
MELRRLILAGVVVLAAAAQVGASGPLGIYGIVEKVVFEPDDKAPDRIQVWGAFAYVDGGVGNSLTVSAPKRGYLYFRLQTAAQGGIDTVTQLVRNEWADLKSVAGTGQAVGFGRWGYIGGFGGLEPGSASQYPPYILERSMGNPRTDLRVRPATEAPTAPALYQTDSGVVKLSDTGSHAAIVKQLKAALR